MDRSAERKANWSAEDLFPSILCVINLVEVSWKKDVYAISYHSYEGDHRQLPYLLNVKQFSVILFNDKSLLTQDE